LALPVEGITYKLLAYVPRSTRNEVHAVISKWRVPQESLQQFSPKLGGQAIQQDSHLAPEPK
ncbi:MAG: hypothetical protein ACP5VS_16060, partial [Desulfomonilaceae bacterium]